MIAQSPSSQPLPLRRSEPFLPPSPLPSPLREPPKERSWSSDERFAFDHSQRLTQAVPAPSSANRQRTKALSDKRLLYRKWRTGSHRGASLSIIESIPSAHDATSSTLIPQHRPPSSSSSLSMIPLDSVSLFPTDPLMSPSNDHQIHGHTALTAATSMPPATPPSTPAPISATTHRDELDRRARVLSERFLQDEDTFTQSSTVEALSGSFGKQGSSTQYSEMKKSRSHLGLSDLERAATINASKSSASGVQRGLKDSVMHDMCHAVVKQMVGDAISLTAVAGSVGSTAASAASYHPATNHLYAPVLASVQTHFKQLPARYALSVDPDDVPMHMRLLANQKRRPDDIYLHAHFLKNDDGSINPTICEVVLVAQDRDSLLDAITRGLSSLKGSIQDADVMTTKDGVTLDRFVVKGSFVPPERLAELRRRILENLARSALAAEHSDKDRQDQMAASAATAPPQSEALPASPTTTPDADPHSALRLSLNTTTIKPEWRLNFSELILAEPVGTGRSGQTYAGSWRGTRVAVKLINLSHHNQSVSEEILQEFHREVAVVSRLRHPNIVLFLGASIEPPKYCLVFEYMENGALTDLVRRRRTPIDFFRIAREIAMGMNYLHLCNIMHRDLKSANVLLDVFGTVKISDFGLSCVLEAGTSSDLTAETGTYRWMAPEVIGHEPYSAKADVYSFGVILWEMIGKDQPFKGMTPIQAAFAVARQNLRPPFPDATPPCLRALVNRCWHQNPADRPTFATILDMLPPVQAQMRKLEFHQLNFVFHAL